MKFYVVQAGLDLLAALGHLIDLTWVGEEVETAVLVFPTKAEAVKAIKALEEYDESLEADPVAYLYTLDLSPADVCAIFNEEWVSAAVGETSSISLVPKLDGNGYFVSRTRRKWPRETWGWVETRDDYAIKKVNG